MYSLLQVFFEKTLKYDENHLVRWVIGSFGFAFVSACVKGQTLNVPMWAGKNYFLKCAVGKFLKPCVGLSVGKLVSLCRVAAELSTEFLSSESLVVLVSA